MNPTIQNLRNFAPRKSFRYSALTVGKLYSRRIAVKTPLPNSAQQIYSTNQRLIKETLQSVVISGDLNYALVTQYMIATNESIYGYARRRRTNLQQLRVVNHRRLPSSCANGNVTHAK